MQQGVRVIRALLGAPATMLVRLSHDWVSSPHPFVSHERSLQHIFTAVSIIHACAENTCNCTLLLKDIKGLVVFAFGVCLFMGIHIQQQQYRTSVVS